MNFHRIANHRGWSKFFFMLFQLFIINNSSPFYFDNF